MRDIARRRLENQGISRCKFRDAAEVVSRLGAVQAQDYGGAKWSIGLRLPEGTDSEVERAIEEKIIVRTWLMRGTLHFASAADLRWMSALLAARLIAGSAPRHRQLELDEAQFARSRKLFARALRTLGRLTREEMFAVLEKGGISPAGQRGYHILWRCALEGLICFGPTRGRRPTFVLLDDWVPASGGMSRNRALGELAGRYFSSRGPATLHDFAWWSGLTIADARAGIEAALVHLEESAFESRRCWMPRSAAAPSTIGAAACLLPGFDEYLLGYRDRCGVLDARRARKIHRGGGLFSPAIVLGGRIIGVWRGMVKKGRLLITLRPFDALAGRGERAIDLAAGRYARFLGLEAWEISMGSRPGTRG